MKKTSLGILSVGLYLPEAVRTNDWWPAEVVAKWRGEAPNKNPMRAKEQHESAPTRGVELFLEAMAEVKSDPFRGAVERRIRPANMKPSEMEILASKDALARAGIKGSQIDLLLAGSEGPDTLLCPNAPLIHDAIGAPSECFSTNIEGVCNSFMQQLTFADSLIQTGKATYGLLVQSCSLTSILRQEDPFSPWFGDAATAMVVGPVPEGSGLLAQTHVTDASLYNGMLAGHPEGAWYDGLVPRVYIPDFQVARRMAMSLPDMAKSSLDKIFAKTGISPKEINFFGTHQPSGWLRRVIQELVEAPQAKSCDTFAQTASVGPCNLPISLAMGERAGLLNKGDLVGAWTGGAGITHSAMLMRWASSNRA